VIPLTLAFGASVAWGASDFLGGLVSRRLPLLVVLLAAQLVGLTLAAAAWVVAGAAVPTPQMALLAAAAGVAELAGFACLYRGLAVGTMCVVAPLAALTAVLPVVAAVAGGEPVGVLRATGMVLAVAGTAGCAWDRGTGSVAKGALLGVGAAVAFGVFLLALGDAGAQAGAGAVLIGRGTSVLVLVLVLTARRPPQHPGRADWMPLAVLGCLDVMANLAYAGAATGGSRAATAVLASLYPLTTIVLAWRVLREPLGAVRGAGVAAVLTGIALISAV
jgi:drug/metabolite transporter (DMT)-like permease